MSPDEPTVSPRLRPDIIYPSQLNIGNQSANPDDPIYDWRILAEGDSWFSIGAIPSSNLLFELRFEKWTAILNLAYPGDTIAHMSELASNSDLVRVLATKNFNYKWDAILLSGGGNDIIDVAGTLVLNQPSGDPKEPSSYIDTGRLTTILKEIQAGYTRIVELRDAVDSQCKGVPIIVHTYDYPTPRNAPATFLVAPVAGPWLYKAFAGKGVDPTLQQGATDYLINRLAESLHELTTGDNALSNFHVVRTCGTLIRAESEAGNSNDWLNEIHPNHDGYRKISSQLSQLINQLLPQ